MTEVGLRRHLKFAILEVLTKLGSKQHKMNLIGRGYHPGRLEEHLGRTFEAAERAEADRAFEELRGDGLIQATYADLSSPEQWVEVTGAGRAALDRRALDDLDLALQRVSPHLVELRDGAWAAASSGNPDALRQAAHSARELVDQMLKEGAPDDEIKAQDWFNPDSSSRTGVTRRHRLRLLMRKFRGSDSGSDLIVADKAADLLLAMDDRLKGLAHRRGSPSVGDVVDTLRVAETALKMVLMRVEADT